MTSQTKNCQNCKQSFTIEPEDFSFYESMQVPPPTWCPECRLVRRLCHMNYRYLYRDECDGCQKQILSIYSPDKPYKVYCSNCWWSDNHDSIKYGRDYDFSRPFFEQYKELLLATPQIALILDSPTLINSDYCNAAGHLRNCYLVFNSDFDENCYYGENLNGNKDCVDVLNLTNSELCYESSELVKCHRVYYSQNCEGCNDVYFSNNLIGCSNCVGCVGLRNGQFCIFNKQLSETEYKQQLLTMNFGSRKFVNDFKEQAVKFWKTVPYKYLHGSKIEDVTGDYIVNAKNAKECFHVVGAENCKFCALTYLGIKDSYDYTCFGNNAQLIYECANLGQDVQNIKFSLTSYDKSFDHHYSCFCLSSNNLFGCAYLRKKQFCILNQQYSESEYRDLLPKIIEHMNAMPYVDKHGRVYRFGEFFPPEISPFGYNETLADDYFPKALSEIEALGMTYKQPEEKNQKPTLGASELPDDIKEVGEDIVKQVIACAGDRKSCTKLYRISSPEFNFHKLNGIPLPRFCPNCRSEERKKFRNPMKLWSRECACAGAASKNGVYRNAIGHSHGNAKCQTKFETAYAPDRPEIVYCEECYREEMI
ncbi:MAG: hypothetical protein V1821_00215 [bacterium]